MLDVMERCFPIEYPGWRRRLREAIPSLGVSLVREPGLADDLKVHSNRVLVLTR
jgi:malate dehydrogenase (quinone)